MNCLRQYTLPPKYKPDLIAEKYGHSVLRTPQYHPEPQPIEKCWGIVKNHCRGHCDFTMKNLRVQLSNGLIRVTRETCQNLIEKIYKKEEEFWREDAEADDGDKIEFENHSDQLKIIGSKKI